MFKLILTSVFVLALAAVPAQAMCCGGKDKAAGKSDAKMQCMKMDMTKTDDTAQSSKAKSDDPHAGMDMGKDGAMDHSKMAGCCCGCCGNNRGS